MIIINNLKEIEKFKMKTTAINNGSINNLITYEFKEDGKLACVIFNCEIPFGISDLSRLVSNGDEEDLLDLDFTNIDCYQFIAKEFNTNNKFRVGRLQADKFIFKEPAEVFDDLQVTDLISGTSLDCEFVEVICREIDCDSIFADKVICEKLKAKSLITPHYYSENIVAENINYYNEYANFK